MFLLCIGDRRKLLADCDSLIAFQITRKELLESSDKVHSTTPESTPVKNVKVVRSSPGAFTDTESDKGEPEFETKK